MTPDPHDEETQRNRAGRVLSEDDASSKDETNADTGSAVTSDSSEQLSREGDAVESGVAESDASSTESESSVADDAPEDASPAEQYGPVESAGPRDVVVPTRVFKLVTVVTTLLAVPAVVLGFMFLDAATLQTSVARATVLLAVSWLGIPVDESVLSVVFGLLGVALIVAGAGVYIVGSRFRAAGMGNAEEDTDEQSNNG
jgi:hypothetical protein